MHGVTGSNLSGSSIYKVLLLIKFLISFKVAFNRAFLTSAVNLVTSAKLLGYRMKCYNSDPDSPKLGNKLFSLFTIALNNFCEPFPILFAGSSAPFH